MLTFSMEAPPMPLLRRTKKKNQIMKVLKKFPKRTWFLNIYKNYIDDSNRTGAAP